MTVRAPSVDPTDPRGPSWIADAIRQSLAELRAFVVTSFAFARSPGRFADEWYRGERRAMNPIGMLATATAIVLPVGDLVSTRVLHASSSDTLLAEALDAVGPYLYYAALGAIAHPLLRLGGARRALSGSIAVAIYAGILPGMGATLVVTTSLALYLLFGNPVAAPPGSGNHLVISGANGHDVVAPLHVLAITVAAFAGFLYVASAGLAGLHRVRWWRALLALLVAVVVSGFFFGHVNPPGSYGLHLELRARPHGISFGLDL